MLKSKNFKQSDYDKIAGTLGENHGNVSAPCLKHVLNRKKNYSQDLQELLRRWRETHCSKATLRHLVDQLDQAYVGRYTSNLRKHYSLPEYESEADDDGYPQGGLGKKKCIYNN